ncbi:response regulator [Ihubacter sp. rT4E-8]|uniref:hybrid sensor histidine kinase/response regulator n=1 Tax=Ihubacter sp. rT4E-8 TaxID=3242369 RepID=UPI003CF0D9C4
MYHCHIRFYLIGCQRRIWKQLKEVSPFEHFTHEFLESEKPEESLAAKADVILVDLPETDLSNALQLLIKWKQAESQLILLTDILQIENSTNWFSNITDIWPKSMPDTLLQFHIKKWYRGYKEKKDAWQTKQYLETTINSTPDLIWYKDKSGIHKKVNDSFCKTVNKTKSQVEGRGHAYIWDVEKDDPACIESERIVMETQKTCVSEETILSSGEIKILTTYKSPLYDLDGSVMGTMGIGIDITQERAYADELIQQNQTLEMLFTTMDCGIMCHSLDGSHIISINKAALRILGYDSEKELVEDGFDLVAASVFAEDKKRLQKSIRSLKNEGDNVSVDYRVRHADGEVLYVTGNIKLIQENGQLYYQRYLLDRTAQKLQEDRERLEDKRRQMELVHALSIEYVLVCFFDLDTGAGKVLRIGECKNDIMTTIFNGDLVLEDCLGQYIADSIHEEDKEAFRLVSSKEHLEKELSKKDMCYINYRTTCCGEIRYFQMKAVRAGNWNESRSIVLGFRCLDEEMRDEREKKALLEDALSQANRANKAKSTFLSNMSHDIRTPMNAIIGFTALAITHIDHKEQVAEYLKKIMTSGNHLLSLINDVLDMSRIESGKIHLEEQPCSLPEILHELHNIIQADVNAKQLDLYLDAIDIENEEICCDRLRLNQVLLNLLSNSIKYTGAGGTVSLKVIEKPGAAPGFANFEFHIKDNGIGMKEDFVAHIFEPFERERNSTSSGIQGTGLGMAITKNIVDMMNGTIEVKSQHGVGTEVIVALTFRLHHQGKKEPVPIPELNGLRALVVDDDYNTCDSVSCMLQQIGLRAEWTLSGKEAVLRTRQSVSRNDHYFVYIIDWLLPDMNGIEVARRIRQETGRNVPIIVLTAYDWSDIEDEAREAGVTAFCSKPLFFSELRGCLHSLVSRDQKDSDDISTPEVLRDGHILLVEDNELNQEIAVAILEEAGLTVDVAENGRVAIDMLLASTPGYYQLILMDIQMPVMNGYDAAKAIRKLENKEYSDIPIIAMTANAFDEDKREALKCGMNGHIAKPIDIEVLLEALDEMLAVKES